MQEELLAVCGEFPFGSVLGIEPYGEGHINRTYLVTASKRRYILQRMNTEVFPDPDALMQNICAVTAHLRLRAVDTLNVIFTKGGKPFYRGNGCYRAYDFFENTLVFQNTQNGEILKNAGEAFGAFQGALDDFDAAKLQEVIPHFHDTPKRFCDFTEALSRDVCARRRGCADEIAFVTERKETLALVADALRAGKLKRRVTHNDTKLNNVLMDASGHRARAVIDLDTVMQGSLLYDFGDAIRFGASTAREDERDLGKVHFSLPLFEAYAEGFCKAVAAAVTDEERNLFAYSAYLMTMECGIRFLTDYLAGDVYFAVKYPEHNLVRARTQLRLAEEMQKNAKKMQDIADGFLS